MTQCVNFEEKVDFKKHVPSYADLNKFSST